jgi:hypothetical protein
MTPSSTSAKAALSATRASVLYRSQRAYVAAMFEVLGRLLVAGAQADPEIQRELKGFPDGLTLGFSVFGETLGFRLVYRGGRLALDPRRDGKPDLEIVFKHIAHAFALLTFQESTPEAYAYDRMISHGDVPLTMRFVRCLDRVQGVMLPDPIAARALKSLPEIPAAQRLLLAARIAGGLMQTLVPRSQP